MSNKNAQRERDKDFYMLRQLEDKMHKLIAKGYQRHDKEYVELQSQFDDIMRRYGFKPEVYHSRRASSRRKPLKKIKRIETRARVTKQKRALDIN